MPRTPVALLALALAAPPLAAQDVVPPSQRMVEQALLPQLRIKGRVETHALEARMRALRVPAVSIAVVRGGRIEWARAYGLRDVEAGVAADTSTLFQAASISKPVAALGMLRLVARGALGLDRDVNEYLRRWRLPPSDSAKGRPVTLRQLASHTGGTTVHGFPGYGPGDSLPSLPAILDGRPPANTAAVRVVREPGRAFEYSGGGTTIEQLAMEDVTTPGGFADWMRTEVLAPLDMAHSTYAQPLPASDWTNAAVGYRDHGTPVEGRAHTYPEQAAAGLWTTPSDLARMLLAVRAVVRGERTDFLPDTLARQILVPQAGGPVGIGFFVQGAGDSLRFGHGGSNEGFRAEAVLYRDSGDGAVVMTNSDAGQRVAREILSTVALANGWRGFLAPEIVLQRVPPATLERYVGRWQSDKLPPARIARHGDALTFQIEGDSPVPMVALGPAEFYIAEADAHLRFPGAPARVDRMEVELPGLTAVYARRAGE